MIKRVYGEVNDLTIEFKQKAPDEWEVEINPSQTGAYYLDLYAEDLAGNVSYFATALIETGKLEFTFKIVKYSDDISMKRYIDKLKNIHFQVNGGATHYEILERRDKKC